MAAVFLVMLYEYSPLFYISVITLCFIITAAMVLGWFGFDVPVILRSSDEAESLSTAPEKTMVQVTNPFALELGTKTASITEGITLRPGCLEECVLTCYWGCSIQALQLAMQSHQRGPRLSTPQLFQEALHFQYHHCQSFILDKESKEEQFSQIPADLGITDLGPMPRERYPLVAVLTLAEPDARETYNIVANVAVIHVPDDKYRLSARVLFQHLLTAQGNMYELKPLFMSSDNEGSTRAADPPASGDASEEPQGPGEEAVEEEDDQASEGEWSEAQGKDCVVCQNAPLNRVLLPCRHACVCDGCVSRLQHCPMCRAFVMESFALCQRPPASAETEEEEEEENKDVGGNGDHEE
ncbi:cell growth regulator with RING finger domain protein 1 [Alosa sapidissima]|uniref:cell growth regulator with RING finger domain protein 1 n=1 Tax=Alosa sapidissima TaxID=34773 RepID=UPI001C0A2538|nr:cell growth regulator with RING finger domain protein 1 [Alosa sapidissima]